MDINPQVIIKGLPEEVAYKIGYVIEVIIKFLIEKDQNIDLRRLTRIIITTDFANELSIQTTSQNPITYTNESYAQAIGKTLNIRKNDDFEIIMILDANWAIYYLLGSKDNPKTKDIKLFSHLLHHELCHVHDNNKKIDALQKFWLKYECTGKSILIQPLAEMCWAEYIANFLSSSTVPEAFIVSFVGSLKEAVKRTKKDLEKEILKYRTHSDLKVLLEYFERHGNFLIKNAAYLMGYLDGLNRELSSIDNELFELISNSYFKTAWFEMQKALRYMHSQYPKLWKDIEIYNSLTHVMEQYYSDMGLVLSNTPEGQLYVHIPFTPNTTLITSG